MDKIITLLAVALGWLLNELTNLLRLRREDRRAVGPVLRDLLEIRHRLIALDFVLPELKKHFPIPPEAEFPLKQILIAMVPEGPHFAERYEEAVSIVARAEPLLAFRLTNQPVLGRLMNLLRDLVASDQAASKFWATVGEPKLLELVKPLLEELILDVARAHGPLTKWRTRRYLKKPLDLAPDEQQKISAFLSELQKQQSASPPTPSQ